MKQPNESWDDYASRLCVRPIAEDVTGVWIVYGWGDGLYVRAVFNDELEARRWKDEKYDYDKVKFVEFAEEIK